MLIDTSECALSVVRGKIQRIIFLREGIYIYFERALDNKIKVEITNY